MPEDQPAVAASYGRALFADLDKVLGRLPRDRCAVQWDVAVEFGLLEGAMGPGSAMPMEQLTPGLVRCVDDVPGDVPVGLHLCYGDYGHRHFKQPESVQMQVDLVNAVVSSAQRTVDWASFTVPQASSDADFFAPLRDLAAGPETELYFALVPYHPDDQPNGTTAAQIQHIETALAGSSAGRREWGTSARSAGWDACRRRCAQAARSPPRDPGGLTITALPDVTSAPRSALVE